MIFSRLLFLGGPPRSGTTLLARILNQHPQIMTIIHDHVCEFWDLYNYRQHSGLVAQLLKGPVSPAKARKYLYTKMKKGRWLEGAAPSSKTRGLSLSPPSKQADFPLRSIDRRTARYRYPMKRIRRLQYISMKSPEISLVLPELAALFPESKFVLIYRSPDEVAESMFRSGENITQIPVFWKRWEQSRDKDGRFIPPSAVPSEWNQTWQSATSFQRCLLCAGGYLSSIFRGLQKLTPGKAFLFCYQDLLDNSSRVFNGLADFLQIESSGFQSTASLIHGSNRSLEPGLRQEKAALEKEINYSRIWDNLQHFDAMQGNIL